MNILFIGNSYTFYNDMPALFEGLAKNNNKDADVYSVTKGGRQLLDYETADETTQKLHALLSERRYDVCIIQEQSVLPAGDYDAFLRGLAGVVNKIGGCAGRLILYSTWGRKSGSAVLSEHNWTHESMTELLSAAYLKAAKLYGADVSPVGINFSKVMQIAPEIELYDADLSHPSYIGSCLAALTHYYTVFGEFPDNCDNLSLDSGRLSALKSVIGG